jgi:PPM family protein phosphatase
MSSDINADTGDFSAPPTLPDAHKLLGAPVLAQVDLGALSHPGKVRDNNEDCYLVSTFERALRPLLTNVPESSLPSRLSDAGYGLLVADGIGGHAAGEVASRLAATILVDLALCTPDWVMRLDEDEQERVVQRFAWRYREIDSALKAIGKAEPSLAGMGTTLTVACSFGDDLLVAHVGDSRAYLFHAGRLRQLTRDHTYAQALADGGLIAPEAVATHRLRHILTRALGTMESPVQADIQFVQLGDGDQVLVCTDGLTDLVDDDAIAAILTGGGTAQEACAALVDAALERGGKDNVTVALARYRFPVEA